MKEVKAMGHLKIILGHIWQKPSLYFFVFLVIFTFDRHHRYEFSKDKSVGPLYSDVAEYYTFLPDFFLGDVETAEKKLAINRRTIGMAILYAPAFFVGDQIASYSGAPRSGYSEPYQWSIRWGSIIYCLMGLFLCRKSLLRFFPEWPVCISLAAVFFGTNLFYYTYSWGELPHTYLFFLYALFAYSTIKWFDSKTTWPIMLSALVAGMITLIRPTGIIVMLFPLLYNISNLSDFKRRIRNVFLRFKRVLAPLLLFFVPILIQMCIWKIYMGRFVYYSYGKERFFFNDPQLVNFLFSFRKGWLLYTPMMLFALAGICFSSRRLAGLRLFMPLFTALTIYILSSWWDWSFGGSFGCRAMVESYAFLLFPFAAFVSQVWELKSTRYKFNQIAKGMLLLVFYLLIEFNLLQSWQYRRGAMHWSGMNKTTYRYLFLRQEITDEDFTYLNQHFTPTRPEEMIIGKRDE